MNRKPHIAALMMVKNESKRLSYTLKSLEGYMDSLIVFDTGSTDNTIDILKEWSKKTGIPLRLKQGEFVNFSVSRNVSLEFADTFMDVDYLMLFDCNDELRGGDELLKFAKEYMDKPATGFLTCQHWWSGQYDTYFNMRFIKPRSYWRYKGSVHEFMNVTNTPTGQPNVPVIKMPESIVLYQDRTSDDDKSGKRFKRDYELLLADYKKDPTETRTLFYLAQTCSCLQLYDEAFYYYKQRSALDGFFEEKFHAYLRAGDLSINLGHDWYDTFAWYMKAFEFLPRVEPINRIVEHYISKKNWPLAYHFSKLACSLKFPDHLILFIDKGAYDYTRWHLMGIIAYYVGEYKDGKEACEKAIKTGINTDLNNHNLKFYIDKEKELAPKPDKKQYITQTIEQLSRQNPKMDRRTLETKAELMWKLYQK